MPVPDPSPVPELSGWLSTREAAPLLCNVTPQTVRNHFTVGTRTRFGPVKLKGQRLGGRYFTRREWIDEYLAAIRRADLVEPDRLPRVESPKKERERGLREQARTAEYLRMRPKRIQGRKRK